MWQLNYFYINVFSEYKKPFGRIYFAGSEMTHKWKGQMGGAVVSGQHAARKVGTRGALTLKAGSGTCRPQDPFLQAKF